MKNYDTLLRGDPSSEVIKNYETDLSGWQCQLKSTLWLEYMKLTNELQVKRVIQDEMAWRLFIFMFESVAKQDGKHVSQLKGQASCKC